jgi:hypothetical protein
MRRRRNLSKIPLGGNVYPMPSAAFLEDGTHRLTLSTHSAMGAAGLEQVGCSGILHSFVYYTYTYISGRGRV